MREATLTKDKPERGFIQVQNDDSTAIGAGEPCSYKMDGTDDGLDVERPATGLAAKGTTLLAGFARESIAASARGMVQVYGVVDNLKLVRQTRATSTDSYASVPAIVIGDILRVLAANNGVQRNAAGAAANNLAYCVAGAAIASKASSASTTSDSSTETTNTTTAFIRVM